MGSRTRRRQGRSRGDSDRCGMMRAKFPIVGATADAVAVANAAAIIVLFAGLAFVILFSSCRDGLDATDGTQQADALDVLIA